MVEIMLDSDSSDHEEQCDEYDEAISSTTNACSARSDARGADAAPGEQPAQPTNSSSLKTDTSLSAFRTSLGVTNASDMILCAMLFIIFRSRDKCSAVLERYVATHRDRMIRNTFFNRPVIPPSILACEESLANLIHHDYACSRRPPRCCSTILDEPPLNFGEHDFVGACVMQSTPHSRNPAFLFASSCVSHTKITALVLAVDMFDLECHRFDAQQAKTTEANLLSWGSARELDDVMQLCNRVRSNDRVESRRYLPKSNPSNHISMESTESFSLMRLRMARVSEFELLSKLLKAFDKVIPLNLEHAESNSGPLGLDSLVAVSILSDFALHQINSNNTVQFKTILHTDTLQNVTCSPDDDSDSFRSKLLNSMIYCEQSQNSKVEFMSLASLLLLHRPILDTDPITRQMPEDEYQTLSKQVSRVETDAIGNAIINPTILAREDVEDLSRRWCEFNTREQAYDDSIQTTDFEEPRHVMVAGIGNVPSRDFCVTSSVYVAIASMILKTPDCSVELVKKQLRYHTAHVLVAESTQNNSPDSMGDPYQNNISYYWYLPTRTDPEVITPSEFECMRIHKNVLVLGANLSTVEHTYHVDYSTCDEFSRTVAYTHREWEEMLDF